MSISGPQIPSKLLPVSLPGDLPLSRLPFHLVLHTDPSKGLLIFLKDSMRRLPSAVTFSTCSVYSDAHSFGAPTAAAAAAGVSPARGYSGALLTALGGSATGVIRSWRGEAITQRLANKTLLWRWPPGKQGSRHTKPGGVTRKWNSYF